MARKTQATKPAPIDNARMLECIRGIKEREQTKKNLEQEIKEYQDEIKKVMTDYKLEEMVCDVFTVHFTDVISQRLDTKALKEQCRSIYDKFVKPSVAKRFSID